MVLFLMLAVATTWVVAQSTNTYYACVKDNGDYRIVSDAAECKPDKEEIIPGVMNPSLCEGERRSKDCPALG